MYIYVSCDIETTGLDYENDQVLEVGAVFDVLDCPRKNTAPISNLPTFRALIYYPRLSGSPIALEMNSNLIAETNKRLKEEGETGLGDGHKVNFNRVVHPVKFIQNFREWLVNSFHHMNLEFEHDKYTQVVLNASGKNFAGFDKLFLEKMPFWDEYIRVRHRVLDVGSLYFNPTRDSELPDLEECKNRAAKIYESKYKDRIKLFDSMHVSHNALEDAVDVVKCIRTYYNYPVRVYENYGRTHNNV